MKTNVTSLPILALSMALFSGVAQAKDQIRIVGSSTVYPFTTAVAEQLGKTGVKTPVVESTGTGGGMKLFCEGAGEAFADVVNASRRMKQVEFEACKKNNVNSIIEIKIGYDGVVFAVSKKSPLVKLSRKDLFLALAKQIPGADGKLVANTNKYWSDIDPSLPKQAIEVLGPPPTSGTRDSLHELVMEAGAEQVPALKSLKSQDKKAFDAVWKAIRDDGAYIEAGENDNLIVQKLEANVGAVGIFGYSFLEENASKVNGIKMDGVEPNGETIAALAYPAARELFVYVKKDHYTIAPSLPKFVDEYVSARAMGDGGYLERKGLVALPAGKLKTVQEEAKAGKLVNGSELPK